MQGISQRSQLKSLTSQPGLALLTQVFFSPVHEGKIGPDTEKNRLKICGLLVLHLRIKCLHLDVTAKGNKTTLTYLWEQEFSEGGNFLEGLP